MNWCFALVNRKLAEVFFEGGNVAPKIIGHCYVKKEEYITKKELKWIEQDTAKFQLTYKNNDYSKLKRTL